MRNQRRGTFPIDARLGSKSEPGRGEAREIIDTEGWLRRFLSAVKVERVTHPPLNNNRRE